MNTELIREVLRRSVGARTTIAREVLRRSAGAWTTIILAFAAFMPLLGAQAQSASNEKIIVSGASGNLGSLTVEALLARGVPANRLILVSRTPEEQQKYADLGAS